jgi:hypothetical protein
MKSAIKIEQGIFYQLGGGYAITSQDFPPTTFELREELAVNNMLRMTELFHNEVHVGYWFYSAFKVMNKGGVLCVYMESRREKATKATVLIKQPDIVVIELEGCGVLAISPLVNLNLNSILSEQ